MTATDTANREIISTRMFNAPRETVFAAWTNPDVLNKWWGPHGFYNTFEVCDIRPGGQWKYIMHGPDGKNYPGECEFVEVSPYDRIVILHKSKPRFEITATFVDEGGKTKLIFRQLFEDVQTCDALRPIAVPGNEGNFDKLEATLGLR